MAQKRLVGSPVWRMLNSSPVTDLALPAMEACVYVNAK